MSFFSNGIIYVIVPVASATEEMLNNMKRSFSADWSTLRKSTEITPRYVFKLKDPVSAVFNGYTWYDQDEILVELAKSEWNQ